ncbi:unnamed protein product [Cyclocybe aegerita]|uniref:Uncharacterized protein n=1 Tax=Cyclocybe aegerita TaxID=1973307 RepID=A0A8S0X2A7_CYCAE|nr:unnamed protein product [Cyclocybe aegerita]
MTESGPVQHPPAVKVGGRRLSITKHKVHLPARETLSPEAANKEEEPAVSDYPRPAPPNSDAPHHHTHQEDLPPKKERKHVHDSEKKMQEYAHWKSESTRPTKEPDVGSRNQGTGMRIAQPAGKNFGL